MTEVLAVQQGTTARNSAVRTDSATAARAQSQPGRPSRMRALGTFLFYPLLSLAGAVAAWSIVSYLVLSPERRFLLPPPSQVLTKSLLDWKHLSPMLEALAVTAQVALVGFVVAVAVGVGTGVLMSQAKWIERI
ncbi:MAG: ABC transporter permease, partial [Rhodococcus sp.]|nr:ABC transporter permease [Rhodococcus sp. (in: high G+C Gram-positive bacteria)]